ncbi:Uncharacterised protein [Vibrio cholerae]|uniref:Uncharacterized protein n=1 Tax=Vibrio cholerae TaxID=666 RepID=A0A656A0S3_VIBCL|nr:Uncharacterised protein [Vibrio cholerae]
MSVRNIRTKLKRCQYWLHVLLKLKSQNALRKFPIHAATFWVQAIVVTAFALITTRKVECPITVSI